MRIPIHREGWRLAGVLAAAALAGSAIHRRLGQFFGVLAGFTLWFFRDPERAIPQLEGALVSPADGRVVAIEDLPHDDFVGGPARRLSIFLSVFDVHINRAPMAGRVEFTEFKPGRFLPANLDSAAAENEQNSIGIVDGDYRIVVRQIAGIIARRILCFKAKGDQLGRGERFGLIRFGSRTDLIVPAATVFNVGIGDRVQGGSTIVGIRR